MKPRPGGEQLMETDEEAPAADEGHDALRQRQATGEDESVPASGESPTPAVPGQQSDRQTNRRWPCDDQSDWHVIVNFFIIFGFVFIGCVIFLHIAAFVCRTWTTPKLLESKTSSHHLLPLLVPDKLSILEKAGNGENAESLSEKEFWSRWHTLSSLNAITLNSTDEQQVYVY